MATEEKWYFTKEQLDNTPSRQCGIDAYKELFYRQQAANLIQDMGQRLRVSQLCINTATVYMHRFYVFHSFTHFPWHSMAAAALFLSAKVEEQPRKLEHVIRVHNICKNPRDTAFEVQSERYQSQSQDLVFNENVLLQTLGFDVAIDHPHAHVVRCCHLVRATKDLAQTSYFMASTSLHLTTMCLQYKPTVVACFCIHLACKWSNWEIPLSIEKKEWFSYVDSTVTSELLHQLTEEFLVIFERCPSRLKEKIMAIGDGPNMSRSISHASSPFESEPRKLHPPTDMKDPHHRLHLHEKVGKLGEDPHKHRPARAPHESGSSGQQQRERECREKRERMAQHSSSKSMGPHGNPSNKQPSVPHGHHRPPVDPKMKQHSRPPSMGHLPTQVRTEHRDILREATRDIGIRDSHRDPIRPSDISDVNKDTQNRDIQVRSDKEVEKRAYPVKSSVNDKNNLNNLQHLDHISFSGESRPDVSRSRMIPDPKLMQHKPDPGRRHEDQKSHVKQESDVRKHLTGWYDNKNMYDKSSAHLKQPTNSTSQKMKSPFTSDASKSVPKPSVKIEPHNGSSNGSYGLPLLEDIKMEIKEEPHYPVVPTKKPSMFSPEKTPPRKTSNSSKRSVEMPTLQIIPPPISPLESSRRSRTSSNSSEPELRPVMKKIDQVEGFENILRDSKIGINKHQVPNVLNDNQSTPNIQQHAPLKEMKAPDAIPSFSNSTVLLPLSQPLVNGIETNPTLISNLLKEVPSVPHLPTIATTVTEETIQPSVVEPKEKEHHHKDRKKKNKEKHKHKDKEKHRDEKEKKKKHKDKDKHKSKNRDKDKQQEEVPAQPIKITISKDKIHPPDGGLKIKIPKDRIKTDVIGESSTQPTPGIKIKIPKDMISNMGGESKKRERDRGTTADAPPNKLPKSNYRQHGDKQNGRNSYTKVAHMGDGDTSVHRLAESKYINKGAST